MKWPFDLTRNTPRHQAGKAVHTALSSANTQAIKYSRQALKDATTRKLCEELGRSV